MGHAKLVVLCFLWSVACVCSSATVPAQDPEKQDQARPLGLQTLDGTMAQSREFINGILGPINMELGGRLDHLINGLVSRVEVTWYLYWATDLRYGDEAKADYEAYQKALVTVLERARRPDAFLEMKMADVLIGAAIPELVIDAIGPHVGEGGKLEGMLDDRTAWMNAIERVGRLNAPNERSFQAYEDYLFGKSKGRTAGRANADVIVTHMFKTDSALAMELMLRHWPYRMSYDRKKDGYRFHFGSGGDEQINAYIREGWELAQVNVGIRAGRDLARLRLIPPKVQTVILKGELAKLSTHDTWWIRLYVSESMRQTPPLCEVDVLKKLQQDEREEIRKSAEEALKVAADYARAVEFRKKKEAERRKRGE